MLRIFSFQGCLYQLYKIIDRFSQKTYIFSQTRRPTEAVFPAVSICFPYHELMNYSLALSKLPKFRKLVDRTGLTVENDTQLVASLEKALKQSLNFKNRFFHSLHEEYTIAEIISATTKLDYILKECTTIAPGEYFKKNCLAHHQEYVKDDLICHQFGDYPNSSQKFENDLQKIGLSLALYPHEFFFHFTFIGIDPSLTKLMIFIHPHKRRPCGLIEEPLRIGHPTRKQLHLVSFNRIFTKLLPPPYKPGCHNYPSSRNQMRDDCVVELVRRNSSPVPPLLTLRSDSPIKTFYRWHMTESKINDLYKLNMLECSGIWSKPDCELEEFLPRFAGWRPGNGSKSLEISVDLAWRGYDQLSIRKPIRTNVSLFVDVNALLGIWFGVYVGTIFDIYRMFKKFLGYNQKRKSESRINDHKKPPLSSTEIEIEKKA